MLIFQFTLPREERRQVQAQPLTLQNFNPRSHERSDFLVLTSKRLILYFNPRSHERSDATTLRQGIYRLNFNPRSHERSDSCAGRIFDSLLTISIHAPTRGATSPHYRAYHKVFISIHAPTRGATFNKSNYVAYASQFQSTLPREERPLRASIDI